MIMKGKQNGERVTGRDGELLLRKKSPFIAREAYKTLRTNIIFSLPGAGCKCIAITSSERSEGKSTNSINLAISFGEIGKKILLIDADMRLPTVASKLKLKSQPGLSNLLIEDTSLEDAVQHLESWGLDILPAGNIPPDPTGLLESAQMERLLEQLRAHYDYIVMDLPPVNTVTDALILSKCVDGFLLVIKHNVTVYRAVDEMISRFRLVNGKILGFLYTNAAMEHKRYYKKYYKYSSYGG